MRKLLAAVALLLAGHAMAEEPTGLVDETMLHPLDAFTAYTLKKNEFIYNQSPQNVPLPSWAMWGITDWMTAEIDALSLVGGLFVEPRLPIPSFNFRFKLKEPDGLSPGLAFETMTQYLYREQRQVNEPRLQIRREGLSLFNRLNATFEFSERLRLHASGGFTYAENVDIRDGMAYKPRGQTWKNQFHPDISLSVDHRTRPWVSLHTTVSYGTTFVYYDNIPRKFELAYGFRVAPFLKNRRAFLRNMRGEFLAIYAYFPDARERAQLLLPVLPYFYWQWRW